MGRRVLVCGGRTYCNRALLYRVLDAAHGAYGVDCIIHGGAPGADTLAGEWAAERGVPTQVFLADWKGLGRSAGPTRNQKMILEGNIDVGFAFPGGAGTNDMRRRMKRAGKVCLQINDHNLSTEEGHVE